MKPQAMRWRRPGLIGALLAIVLAFVAPRARADAAEAEQLFRAAHAAFERREFRAAAAAFEEAYRLEPHAAVLYNAALAWQLAGDEPRAADAFARALGRADLEADASRDAARRLEELSGRTGKIEVRGPTGRSVSVAHVKDGHPPLTVYVAPGVHDLTVTGPGAPSLTRRIEVARGATTTVVLPSPQERPSMVEAAPTQQPSPTRWIVSGSLAGLSLVSTATASILGISALHAREDYAATGYTDPDAREKTVGLRTAANVFWGAAIVTGIASVFLFLAIPAVEARPRRDGASTAPLRWF
jgi:tetratricopeptide (TPR) repeat protein